MQKPGLALVQVAAVIVISLSGACATAPQAKSSPPAGVDAEAALRKHLAELETKGPLHFETDTDVIDHKSREVLRQVATQMFTHPRVKVVVSGHADERGDTGYNLALGDRRAIAAQDFLVRLGIPRGRIKTTSLGEEAPLLDGHDESAWATNRRDEFTFLLPARVIAEGDVEAVDVLLAEVTLGE